ncbi:hypothetical protein VNO77_15825 [Canavalia gladiata]|uniref:Late embryogenesis abundant protein LEA-2 subgroup domain-containing protein n=1 Tax=Canavalia gladiata TaxID=3824 RepID=A0AAN9M4Q2_CANGL
MRKANLSTIIFATIICLTILSFIAIFLWFVLKPHLPTIRVDSVMVNSLSTTTSVELTALFNVAFTLRNPNRKFTLSYENLDAAIWFDRRNLALAFFRPFSQRTESNIVLQTWFDVFHKQFKNSPVVRGIAVQQAHGSVDFGLTLNARVRFRSTGLHSMVRTLNVECYPVRVVFPLNDSNHGGTFKGPVDCNTVDIDQ